MKRSKSLSLLLMGSVAFGLSACDNQQPANYADAIQPPGTPGAASGSSTAASGGSATPTSEESMQVFTNVGECVQSGTFSEADCMVFARQALAERPQFSSKEECEASFGEGACEAPQGTAVGAHSGSFWMPMLMGFMAGHFLARGSRMMGSQGLYRDTAATNQTGGQGARSYRTATGDPIRADNRGRVTSASPRVTQGMTHNARPAVARSGTGMRSGFSGGSAIGGGS